MRLAPQDISSVLRRAVLRSDIVTEEDTALFFYDLSALENRIGRLREQFPHDTLHAIAVKACPLPTILSMMGLLDVGAETATLPELQLALKSGIEPHQIVFDSPAKTNDDIRFALKSGVYINADSLEELARIDRLINEFGGTAGIRINPQVGTGSIAASSTAGEYSKFGVSLNQFTPQLIQTFVNFPWLTGVHMHIGSQGCPLELLAAGLKRLTGFINQVNEALISSGRHIKLVDIGGGLPVAYKDEDSPPSIEIYAAVVKEILAQISNQGFRLITEFGRSVFAPAGWVASKVEYVKREATVATAMIHVGADLFLRRCYRPEDWHHDIFVTDAEGNIKTGQDIVPYVIAGPLCFSGDMLGRDLPLPRIEEGDYIVIRDTGAYTLSMWSRYNSRCMPKVIGYREGGQSFEILKKRESPEDVYNFWKGSE